MRRLKQAKNMKKMYRLTCQVLAACAITSTLLLVNGGTAFAEIAEPIVGGKIEIASGNSVDKAIINKKTVDINTDELYTASISGGEINVSKNASVNTAEANENMVSITTGTFHGAITGGEIRSNIEESKVGEAQANKNTVKITGGTFNSQSNTDICGGYVGGPINSNVQSNGNKVEIEDISITVKKDVTPTSYLNRSIYGGYATSNGEGSATAENNSITISGGSIQLMPRATNFSASVIYGGYATNGKTNVANKNILTITGGNIYCYEFEEGTDGASTETEIGGGGTYLGTANENKVTITGGKIGNNSHNIHVYGGNAVKEASGNEVTINGSDVTIYGKVTGGYCESGDPEVRPIVEKNKATLTLGTVNGNVYGGWSNGETIKANKALIEGGTVNGNVYGGYNYFSVADGNEATISGGEVNGNLYGGYSDDVYSVQNNRVVVTGGKVSGNVYGGYSKDWNSESNSVDDIAQNNRVAVTGGTIEGVIYGGYAEDGNAVGNTVTISGGNFKDVYGGFSVEGNANNNQVNLVGKGGQLDDVKNDKALTITSPLFGSNQSTGTGNSLNVAGTGTKVNNIVNFQNLNFYSPASIADDSVMLTFTGDIDLTKISAINTIFSVANNDTVGFNPDKTITVLESKASDNDFTTSLAKAKLLINGENQETAAVKTTMKGLGDGLGAKLAYDISKNTISLSTKSYELIKELAVTDDVTLDKELNLNNQTLNMQQAADATGDAVKYNTLTVNKLSGTGNLMVDADFTENKSDKIAVTEAGTGTVTLTSVLLRSDGLSEDVENPNPFTFITGAGANGVTLNYGTDGTLEASTTDYIYTFKKTAKGVIITKELATSINDFITGSRRYNKTNSFTVTEDTTVDKAFGTINVESDNTRGKELTIGINKNVTLNGTNNGKKVAGITVAEDYTLNVKGQATENAKDKQGTIAGFSVALNNNGTLNVENITFSGNDTDIINNGSLTFTGNNTLNNISGAAGSAVVDSGITTVNAAVEQKNITVKGNGQLILNGATALGSLNVASGAILNQNGGSFVVNSNFINEGNVTLSGLGGSEVDYKDIEKAKNKITGKLTNNGVLKLADTYLTVGEFESNMVEIDANSYMHIIKLGSDLKISANSIGKLQVDKIANAITVVPNSGEENDALKVASSYDKVLAVVEASGVGQKERFTGAGKLIVPEGVLNGEAVFDANGVHKVKGATEDILDSMGPSLAFARIEMNDIRKRMGDVRQVKDTNGIWARSENGKMAGQGATAKFHKFQIGSDKAVSEKWRVGGAVSYTNGNTHYNHGSNSNKTYSGAGYGLYTGKNGEFADVIARVGMGKAKLNFTTGGGSIPQAGNLDRMSYGLSTEVGKTYELKNSFYVEPQAELSYTYTGSDSFTSNGYTYDLDNSNSFIGRLGFTLGYKNATNGTVYTRLSLLHEFAGDMKLTGNGGTPTPFSVDGKDSWVEWAVGAQINTSKATYVYADAEKTFGGKVDEKYRVNVGMRYSF